ncbi:MAG: phosphatase PAP2 family protein [Myxococcota bacterium]|nr:phosphatase PAP2 family protein [Myxococcota bacterium]
MTRWGIAAGLLCLMPTVVVAQTPRDPAAGEGLWPPPARLQRSGKPEGAPTLSPSDAPTSSADAAAPAAPAGSASSANALAPLSSAASASSANTLAPPPATGSQQSASQPVGAGASLLPAAEAEVGPFLGEAYRYQHRGVFRRLLSDYAAIPLGIPRWSGTEWAWFGITVGVTAGLFLPLANPLDQRFQNWLATQYPSAVPHLWSPFNDLFIFGGMFALAVGTLAYGHFTGQDPYVETFSLMLEALVLIQSLHISTKLLLSRDGPNNGTGHFINGPTWATFQRFPEGAPSGHTGTLFALATVVSSYWENPWLSIGVYSVATVFASALVLDRYHYISDVLWGGSMGVAVGRYVVRHRSSRYRYQEGQPQRRLPELQLTPFWAPAGFAGGAAGGALLEGEF